ncbi:allophanate hydrolase [Longimycelium tulufanense]|uniref:Allophanate hydrolase n=1 Tax=Longimycelium tulufanense TaxID=907463 RepID=A0A8J3FXC5_9PSEU|nr:biotin-dependent carboxyltransferase family protein [Longimycelium tulufanense]GGM73308.1 allophanate hydrolase [Longimycelium tulufanense]
MARSVVVERTGPQALVQDHGRSGFAPLGVPPSGALDQPSLRLANRLVGNPEEAAGLEVLLGGLRARAECSCTVAVTGPGVAVSVNGEAVGSHVPLHLAAGDVLELGTPATGLRSYVSVSGGIDVPVELGSRSTDVLSGLGPAPLRDGDVLPLGSATGVPRGADELPVPSFPDQIEIPVLLGPRDDWFGAALEQLWAGRWTVSAQSNRVGVRLEGSRLHRQERFDGVELPSEGMVTGAIQVPPNGLPVIFLADHPTTGGYPVIGVALPEALPLLGQARPGSTVHLRPVG